MYLLSYSIEICITKSVYLHVYYTRAAETDLEHLWLHTNTDGLGCQDDASAYLL